VKSENHGLTAFKNGSYPAPFIAHYDVLFGFFGPCLRAGFSREHLSVMSRAWHLRVTCADYEAMSGGQT
jgi:hypothetical protein